MSILEVKDRSTISCDQKARTEVRPGVHAWVFPPELSAHAFDEQTTANAEGTVKLIARVTEARIAIVANVALFCIKLYN
jgi:hypothetical protein